MIFTIFTKDKSRQAVIDFDPVYTDNVLTDLSINRGNFQGSIGLANFEVAMTPAQIDKAIELINLELIDSNDVYPGFPYYEASKSEFNAIESETKTAWQKALKDIQPII